MALYLGERQNKAGLRNLNLLCTLSEQSNILIKANLIRQYC
jgi:hypothetical protein